MSCIVSSEQNGAICSSFCSNVKTDRSEFTEVSSMSFLRDRQGNRKYLTAHERRAFLLAAQAFPHSAESYCRVLAYTGGRILEVLALTPDRVDMRDQGICAETMKKRRTRGLRGGPMPD